MATSGDLLTSALCANPPSLRLTAETPFETWEALGAWLQTVDGCIHWWTGDWLNWGEDHYGERYAQALSATGWSLSTLEVYAWVAKRVPVENRRPDLSFSHHKAVAHLPPEQQRDLLTRAAEGDEDGGGWTSERLQREVRAMTTPQRALWVLVEANDPADAEALVAKFAMDGRKAKVVGKRSKVVKEEIG